MTRIEPSLIEHAPEQSPLLEDVLDGLRSAEKNLPAKLHYDERGSELFEKICQLDEYYITRTELAIMRDHATDIAASLGERCMVIEPGSGASIKTRLLLNALEDPAAYVPVEISRDFLLEVATRIANDHSDLEVLPVWADFTTSHPLPEPDGEVESRAVYFPGSTIGNFTRANAKDLLENFRRLAGRDGSVVVGYDCKKDIARMEAAYNDAEGITAEFNLNVLDRIAAELDVVLDRGLFDFHAEWDEEVGAIVSYLTCNSTHEARIGDAMIRFDSGERIHMEESHKYTPDEFRDLARSAGLREVSRWSDVAGDFAVSQFVPA